ncbi:MAG: arginine--tRNA ligase, partial [Nitrosopumilus sp.]|nr:arginine--tRNA ligase [Nitrosopumilus sp.]
MKEVLSYYDLSNDNIDFEIAEPPLKEYGDISCNIAFSLSKILKKNPFEIATDIAYNILPNIHRKNNYEAIIKLVSVEKPGFINFKLDLDIFLRRFFSDTRLVTNIPGLGNIQELILIEHTSVNPNKSLHVGHVRNSVIGDCLYRLLLATGHNIRVLNYVDDSGLQIADIIVAFKYADIQMDPVNSNVANKKFDHYCGNHVYVKINELYSTKPDLEIKRKNILKELENPHSQIS